MNLKAEWLSGFTDAVGCFRIILNDTSDLSVHSHIICEFSVERDNADVQILYEIKSFFGCGVVRSSSPSTKVYCVKNISHLCDYIVPFYEKHKLKSKKGITFKNFRKVLLKIRDKSHVNSMTIEYIKNCVSNM